MFLFHLFVLQSAVAAVVQRAGEDVTLTCQHELDGQQGCNGTTWNYSNGRSTTVELVRLGKIQENSEIESDRLRVAANCSLIVQKVTVQDVGRYDCFQYKSDDSNTFEHIEVHRSTVFLSVASIVTEDEVDDKVKLKCFVKSSEKNCRQEAKWRIKDQDIDQNNNDLKIEKSECSSILTLKKSHYLYPPTNLLSCEVTDRTGEKFSFTLRPSGDKKPTRKPETFTKSTITGSSGASAGSQDWWLYLVVAVGLIVLLIVAVMIVRWKRTKGMKRMVDENTADPEDGTSYATISYSRKTDRKAQVHGEDGGETVTYSTVRAAAPPPAGASAEPNNLYSTITFTKQTRRRDQTDQCPPAWSGKQ